MKKKTKAKRSVIPVDFDANVKAFLEGEASAEGLGLAPFLRKLLFTHPQIREKLKAVLAKK